MAKKSKFPNHLYVRREYDSNDSSVSYFVADETADEAEDGERVAVYVLQEVKTKHVNHKLL